jgi:hypothetical protein
MRRIMESWMTMISQVNQYAKKTRVPENVTIIEEAPLLPCQDRSDGLQDIKAIKVTAWLFRHLDSKVIPTLDDLHAHGVAPWCGPRVIACRLWHPQHLYGRK